VSVEYKFSTAKANLYSDGTKDVWVPHSIMGEDGIVQVENNSDGTTTLTAPEWWLAERGLV
jgi:hypothetical protein